MDTNSSQNDPAQNIISGFTMLFEKFGEEMEA